MIGSNSLAFEATSQIKRGKSRLPETYAPLAHWIGKHYNIAEPINIYFDRIDNGKLPRLDIIFETAEDAATFSVMRGYGFNSRKQARIRSEAIKRGILNHLPKDERNKTLIIFSNFETAAREHVVSSIKEEDIEALKKNTIGPDVWLVSRIFGVAIVFFMTQQDMNSADGKKAQDDWTKALQQEAIKSDPYGYIERKPLGVHFDTKENFDTKYNGNWRAYYN